VAETKNPGVLTLLRKSDRKLIFVPVMFVLLRIWGTVHFFVTFAIPDNHHLYYCVERKFYIIFTVLGTLQVGTSKWCPRRKKFGILSMIKPSIYKNIKTS